MRHVAWFCLLLLLAPVVHAQQSLSALSETQKAGGRLYHQRCALCHSGTAPAFVTYGPLLNGQLMQVRGDDYVRKFIMEGTRRMPGFRYGLNESQVNSIIEYLKVLRDSNWGR